MGTVYALYDPRRQTDEVRYVGLVLGDKDPKERRREHLAEALRGTRGHKNNWIRKCIAEGIPPEVETLEADVPEDQLGEHERGWIRYGHEIGWKLTNGTAGGEGTVGYVPTPEAIRNHSEGAKRMWEDPEYRQIMSDLGKARMADPEWYAEWLDTYIAAKPAQSEGLRRAWERDEYRRLKSQQASSQMSTHWSDPANRQRQSQVQKALWEDVEFRAEQAELHRNQPELMSQWWEDEKNRAQMSDILSAAQLRRFRDPDQLARQQQIAREMTEKRAPVWAQRPPCPYCGRKIDHPGGMANHIRKHEREECPQGHKYDIVDKAGNRRCSQCRRDRELSKLDKGDGPDV